jgi:hypothetical protein
MAPCFGAVQLRCSRCKGGFASGRLLADEAMLLRLPDDQAGSRPGSRVISLASPRGTGNGNGNRRCAGKGDCTVGATAPHHKNHLTICHLRPEYPTNGHRQPVRKSNKSFSTGMTR